MPLDVVTRAQGVAQSKLSGERCVESYLFMHAEDVENPSISISFWRPAQPNEDGTAIQTTLNLSLDCATALAAQLRVHLARIAVAMEQHNNRPYSPAECSYCEGEGCPNCGGSGFKPE